GSIGLDLAAAVRTVLLDSRLQKVATGVKGPLMLDDKPHGALLLGRSSSSLQGLFVYPGVIDADYQGEIMVIVKTDWPPAIIEKGSRIAQLVPLLHLTAGMTPALGSDRGPGGFGSTGGLALLTMSMRKRPVETVTFFNRSRQIRVAALLDTGADLTIMA
ncbi:POK9 protein, partial [Probosciger aterrimus]|nr:POK9 protein [Probosciger aterrimus]